MNLMQSNNATTKQSVDSIGGPGPVGPQSVTNAGSRGLAPGLSQGGSVGVHGQQTFRKGRYRTLVNGQQAGANAGANINATHQTINGGGFESARVYDGGLNMNSMPMAGANDLLLKDNSAIGGVPGGPNTGPQSIGMSNHSSQYPIGSPQNVVQTNNNINVNSNKKTADRMGRNTFRAPPLHIS